MFTDHQSGQVSDAGVLTNVLTDHSSGLVCNVIPDLDDTGENDAGVVLSNAFNYISTTNEPYDALAFITDVYSRGEDKDDVKLAEVRY